MTLDERDALAPIVADFAAWSGREGVCVPSVEVVAVIDDEPDMAGQYAGPGEPILLVEAEDYRVALFHELCHALDDMEGLSAEDPDPGKAVDGAAYDTPDLRRKEAFASVCQDGPAAVSFERALAERCDLALDPALARVREAAYPAAPADPDVTIGPAPTAEPLEELADGVIVGAAGRADGAWLLLADGREARVAWWSAEDDSGRPGGGGPAGDLPFGPSAWTTPEDTVPGPGGNALWTWYAHGIAGAGVGGADAWALTTGCDTQMAAGVPAWVSESPMVFAGQVERWVFGW